MVHFSGYLCYSGFILPLMKNMMYATRYQPRELLPASLLPYRQTWQSLARSLPTNTYLVVTNLDNPPQNASMLRLVHQLRWQGNRSMCCRWGVQRLEPTAVSEANVIESSHRYTPTASGYESHQELPFVN